MGPQMCVVVLGDSVSPQMSGVVSGQLGGSPDGCCWSWVALMGPQRCVVVPDTLFKDRVIWEGLCV